MHSLWWLCQDAYLKVHTVKIRISSCIWRAVCCEWMYQMETLACKTPSVRELTLCMPHVFMWTTLLSFKKNVHTICENMAGFCRTMPVTGIILSCNHYKMQAAHSKITVVPTFSMKLSLFTVQSWCVTNACTMHCLGLYSPVSLPMLEKSHCDFTLMMYHWKPV